jgi:hypothetical protein
MPTPFSIIAVNLLRQPAISRYCRHAGMTLSLLMRYLGGEFRCNRLGTIRAAPLRHAAVLNINLGQETAEPVARRLTAADIPFITVSGYDQQSAVFSQGPIPVQAFRLPAVDRAPRYVVVPGHK